MGIFAVVAGVAGSGKSSLMECFRREHGDVVYISQKNIGVSLRSTPATYMDVAPDIRKRFAKAHKIKEQYFTFNGKGGCPVCGGKGVVIAEMAFMDNIETTCEACHGLRYSREALEYTLDGKNIAEVMDLSVRRASEFFKGTSIEEKLKPMMDVGLHYLHLKQVDEVAHILEVQAVGRFVNHEDAPLAARLQGHGVLLEARGHLQALQFAAR